MICANYCTVPPIIKRIYGKQMELIMANPVNYWLNQLASSNKQLTIQGDITVCLEIRVGSTNMIWEVWGTVTNSL